MPVQTIRLSLPFADKVFLFLLEGLDDDPSTARRGQAHHMQMTFITLFVGIYERGNQDSILHRNGHCDFRWVGKK